MANSGVSFYPPRTSTIGAPTRTSITGVLHLHSYSPEISNTLPPPKMEKKPSRQQLQKSKGEWIHPKEAVERNLVRNPATAPKASNKPTPIHTGTVHTRTDKATVAPAEDIFEHHHGEANTHGQANKHTHTHTPRSIQWYNSNTTDTLQNKTQQDKADTQQE